MYCNGLKLSGVLEEFLSLHDFGLKNVKNSTFLKKISVLSAFFLSNSSTVITNLPSRLEKTPNT